MRLVYRRPLAAAVLSLAGVLGAQSPVSAAQHNVAELVRTREQLLYFEVYHTDSRGVRRTAVTITSLLGGETDYVRVDNGNSEAVADLYQALMNTVIDPSSACRNSYVDVRWVIVMNYRDQTRDAIGIGQPYSCVQILSREAPAVASNGLLKYVQRNFPFMH